MGRALGRTPLVLSKIADRVTMPLAECPFIWYGADVTVLVLTNGFAKKTQKTPPQEIALAEQRRRDYLERRTDDE